MNVVLSDKRKSFCDEELGVERFEAEVLSAVDYYPFGMLMPDRQWYANSDSSIAVNGFNGMRNDHEINGHGNSYTTEFRQLDVRLARWFSLDPIYRSNVSMYITFTNNPIIKVDPRGDDDYFDEHGNYLYTDTKVTTNIMIIKRVDWELISAAHGYLNSQFDQSTSNLTLIENLESKSAPLKTYDFSGNLLAIQAITTYYYNKIDGNNELSDKKITVMNRLKGGKIETLNDSPRDKTRQSLETLSAESKRWNNTSSEYINIFLDNGKLYEPLLGNRENLMNALVHENFHLTQNSSPDEYKRNNVQLELDAYYAQMTHSSWANTTSDWKSYQLGNVAYYINLLPENKREKEARKFEKATGSKFDRTPGVDGTTRFKNK